ncbi:hypothetical protein Peur_024894 [Populus x canadensis]
MKETWPKNPSDAYWDENNLESEVMKQVSLYIYTHTHTHFKTQFLWMYEQIGRWRVIKMIAGKGSALRDITGKESELVEKIYS